MPSYLVETYATRADPSARVEFDRRARSAAEELSREGTCVRFDRSIHVLEDEICFYVFEAPSTREVALAAARGALDPIRVVEVVLSREEPSP